MRYPKRIPVIGLYAKGESGCLLVIHETDLIRVAAERLDSLIGTRDIPELEKLLSDLRRAILKGI